MSSAKLNNPLVDFKYLVARAMRHRALECFHRDRDYLKDVIFKSLIIYKTSMYQLCNNYILYSVPFLQSEKTTFKMCPSLILKMHINHLHALPLAEFNG